MLQLVLESISASDQSSALRFLSYISVRSAAALVVSFLMCVLAGPKFIAAISRAKVGQHIRKVTGDNSVDLHEMHAGKTGTPTMGGILMLASIVIAVGLFGNWNEPALWVSFAMLIGFGALGFVDDYRKFTGKRSEGLTSKEKIIGQVALGGAFAMIMVQFFPDLATYTYGGAKGADFLAFPFFKDVVLTLGILYVPFAILVLTASSNAVNLTDGLDGLAAGVSAVCAMCLAVVAYLAGRDDAAEYLIIPFVKGSGEITVIL